MRNKASTGMKTMYWLVCVVTSCHHKHVTLQMLLFRGHVKFSGFPLSNKLKESHISGRMLSSNVSVKPKNLMVFHYRRFHWF